MYGYIYETTNLYNGKKYIGKRVKDKFDEKYVGSGSLIKPLIKRYGLENFECHIINMIDNVSPICESRDELIEAEKFYIAYYDAVNDPNYYNIAPGGDGGKLLDTKTPKQLEQQYNWSHMPASDKLKAQLSEYRKNVVVTDSTKQKLSELAKDTKSINNGTIVKHVPINEVEEYLSNGWKLGQLTSSIKSGSKMMNNGVEQKFIAPNDFESYLNCGWVFGKIRN